MSSESLKTLFEIIGIVLLGFTFLDGGLVWYFGRQVNKEQAAQLQEFDAKLTEAKTGLGKQEERAANAERELSEVKKELADAKTREVEAERKLEEVRKKQAPRWITVEKFVAAFGKARPGKAFIQYQTGSEETAMFAAGSIAPALVASGWHLEEAPRLTQSAHPSGFVAAMSEIFLYGNMKNNPSDPLSPMAGLRRAFSECGFPPAIFADNNLPEDTVLIVVGPKI